MPKYIIERDIPAIGEADQQALKEAAITSNEVLHAMQAEAKDIHWQNSFVAGDKTFCVYECADESLIHEHAQRSGFPASKITKVSNEIDPTTATG